MASKIRIHIQVSSKDVWKRFKNFESDFYDLSKVKTTTFIADNIVGNETEFGLFEYLAKVVKLLDKDGILIADIIDYKKDAFNCCIHYLGGNGITLNEISNITKHEKIKIDDISAWFNTPYCIIELNEHEKEVLHHFETNKINQITRIHYFDVQHQPLQIDSKIHIQVKSLDVWQRFKNFSINNIDVSTTQKTSFVIEALWSMDINELSTLVEEISCILKDDGIVLAEATAYKKHTFDIVYCYSVYSFNQEVKVKYNGGINLRYDVKIENIAHWLNYTNTKLNDLEKDVLFNYGIIQYEYEYISFDNKFVLPDKIYLRETSEHNEVIEATELNETVTFIHKPNEYDNFALEAMTSKGTLGILPSQISDQLTPYIINDCFKYTASIVEILPASKRNKHSKSSIVAVRIKK